MAAAELLSWINGGLLLLILLLGRRNRLWTRYRAFFIYLGYELICTIVAAGILRIAGVESDTYRLFYYGTSSLTPLLQTWVLLDALHLLSASEQHPRIHHLLAGAAAALVIPVAWSVFMFDVDGFHRVQAVFLVYQMSLCVLIYIYLAERRDLNLGTNLGGILAGTALLAGSQSLNFLAYFNGGIPFPVFQILVPALYGGALGIYALSMWESDPLRRRATPELDLPLQQGLRLLLRSLLAR